MFYPIIVLEPLTIALGTVLYVLCGLLVNYNAARKTGLPLIVLPVDCGNLLWLIIDRKIVQFVSRILFCSGSFTRFNWRGWEILDRYRAHQELGDAILFVRTEKNYLQLCDADAVSDIFQRRADFLRPPKSTGKVLTHTRLIDTHEGLLEMLNIFGPNVGTVGSPSFFYRSNCSLDRLLDPNSKDIEESQLRLSITCQSTRLDGKHTSSYWHNSLLVLQVLDQ